MNDRIQESPIVTTRTTTTWLDARGFIRTVTFPRSIETIEDAKANIEVCRQLGQGVKRPILVDFRGMRCQDRDARGYYGGPEASEVLSAAALVVGSALTRVLANFYTGLNQTRFPTRMFTSEDEAIAWLMGFVA